MIREAIEYVVGLSDKVLFEDYEGRKFSNKKLHLMESPRPESLTVTTLTSFCEFAEDELGKGGEPLFAHVVSPTSVRLARRNRNLNRDFDTVANATPDLPESLEYNRFMNMQAFIIGLLTKFLPTDNRDMLLKFVSSVDLNDQKSITDDGVQQQVLVKQNSVLKDWAGAPNRIALAPFRTFLDVPQPESDFIFRLQRGHDGNPQLMLAEADGGAWKIEALRRVGEHLRTNLPSDIKVFY